MTDDSQGMVIHLDMVRGALDEAKEVEAAAPAPPAAKDGNPKLTQKPSSEPKGPREPVRYGPDGLPEDCPVTPLGIVEDVCYYLDASRQLRALKAKDHSRLGVQNLFGRQSHLLYRFWPRMNADGDVTGWKPELAAEKLMASAASKGIWKAAQRERGPGAWLGEEGNLILHCGDEIWVGPDPRTGGGLTDGQWIPAGVHKRHVYPAGEPGPRPAIDAATPADMERLLNLLRTWNWKRKIDAVLKLGGLGAGALGGALKWRPVEWTTGGTGTGKSTLQDFTKNLMDGGLIDRADATAANIWQTLGHATLPVQIDEAEAEDDNRKLNSLVRLARLAASGGKLGRGGSDHNAHEFEARCCFWFTSILVPPLLPQDRNRIAVLELGQLSGAPPPSLKPSELRALGATMRRRLVDGWPRFAGTFDHFRKALEALGHSARGCDLFGTLLAAAHVLLFDHQPDECSDESAAAEWVAQLTPADLSEIGDDDSDEEVWLQHLVTSVIDPYGKGVRSTLGEWISRAAGGDDDHPADEANLVIANYGLKVLKHGDVLVLAVANRWRSLEQLMAGTHWAGRSGAVAVYVQAARRLADKHRGLPFVGVASKPIWFAGAPSRATLLPIQLFLRPGAIVPAHPQPEPTHHSI